MVRKTQGRKKTGAKRVLRRKGKPAEVHCMLIPTDQELLLLPTSVMAEVVDYQDPRPMENAPPWLLGQVEWESRQVPIFSFSALINGKDVGKRPEKAKIMILKSLAESARVPYLGIMLADLPRPVTIKEDDLVQTGDENKSLGVFSHITVEKDEAIIPDIDRLTHLVTHATFGALPITSLDD